MVESGHWYQTQNPAFAKRRGFLFSASCPRDRHPGSTNCVRNLDAEQREGACTASSNNPQDCYYHRLRTQSGRGAQQVTTAHRLLSSIWPRSLPQAIKTLGCHDTIEYS